MSWKQEARMCWKQHRQQQQQLRISKCQSKFRWSPVDCQTPGGCLHVSELADPPSVRRSSGLASLEAFHYATSIQCSANLLISKESTYFSVFSDGWFKFFDVLLSSDQRACTWQSSGHVPVHGRSVIMIMAFLKNFWNCTQYCSIKSSSFLNENFLHLHRLWV